MALDNAQPFSLVLSKDVTVPVRPTLAKDKGDGKPRNTYWAVLTPVAGGRRVDTGFGVPIPLAGGLPQSVTLVDQDGTKHVLALEPAPEMYEDRKTRKMVKRANPGVRHQSKLVLSGVEKQVKVSVSDLGDGRKNVKVSISGVPGGGGGAGRTFTVSDL